MSPPGRDEQSCSRAATIWGPSACAARSGLFIREAWPVPEPGTPRARASNLSRRLEERRDSTDRSGTCRGHRRRGRASGSWRNLGRLRRAATAQRSSACAGNRPTVVVRDLLAVVVSARTRSARAQKSPVSKTGDSQETPSRGHDPSVVGSTGVGDHPPEAGDGAASRSAIAGLVRSRHPVPTASSSVAGRVRSEVLGPFPGDLSVLALALARAGGAAVDPVAGEMAVCRRLPLAFGVGVSSRAEPCPQRCASSRPGSTYPFNPWGRGDV